MRSASNDLLRALAILGEYDATSDVLAVLVEPKDFRRVEELITRAAEKIGRPAVQGPLSEALAAVKAGTGSKTVTKSRSNRANAGTSRDSQSLAPGEVARG